MLVTDAMPPVGGSRRAFALYGEEITVRDGRCVRRTARWPARCLDMATAVRNCVRLLGVPLEHALRFASTNPASFLGVDHWLGRLAPGYRADIVAFHRDSVEVVETWWPARAARPRNNHELMRRHRSACGRKAAGESENDRRHVGFWPKADLRTRFIRRL